MFLKFFSAITLLVFTGSIHAQSSNKGIPISSAAPQSGHLTYTLGEGYEVTANHARSGPETIFNNRGGMAYYYFLRSNTDEFVDEGSFPKSGVNGTEQVNGMIFDYCSTVADPIGDAIHVELRLYEETIGGLGITGWVTGNRNEKCGYFLGGLPGDTALTGLSCWTVTLDLIGGFECTLPQEQTPGSMNNFGWSTVFMDAANSGGTGNIGGTSSGYGTKNYYEWYDPTQAPGFEYLGSVSYGTANRTNFTMSMKGLPTDTSAYYSANPGTADTVDLQADVEVRAGVIAGWTVNNPTPGRNYALLASSGAADMPGLVGGQAHLLVNWLGNPLLPAPVVMSGSSYLQLMPNVIPPAIHVQAAEYSGALTPSNITAMSNGLRHAN
jgi:hypothetical protein